MRDILNLDKNARTYFELFLFSIYIVMFSQDTRPAGTELLLD